MIADWLKILGDYEFPKREVIDEFSVDTSFGKQAIVLIKEEGQGFRIYFMLKLHYMQDWGMNRCYAYKTLVRAQKYFDNVRNSWKGVIRQ